MIIKYCLIILAHCGFHFPQLKNKVCEFKNLGDSFQVHCSLKTSIWHGATRGTDNRKTTRRSEDSKLQWSVNLTASW